MLKALELTRQDYFQGEITKPKCVQLLPSSGDDKTQKIVLGDSKGNFHSFGFRKGELKHVFQTCLGHPITGVALGGGTEGGRRDRVFVSSATDVQGFSMKGKRFMKIVPGTSEPVSSIYVEGLDLLVCGLHAAIHYRELKDFNYVSCGDKITSVMCLPQHKVGCVMPVLASQDRLLRVFKEKQLLYEVEVPGKPTTLERCGVEGGVDGREVVYGTLDGRIGKILLEESGPCHLWDISNPKKMGGVSCLDWYDLTGDGVLDLMVGRDDGKVEVYGEQDNEDVPVSKFTLTCQEAVTSVHGGKVCSSEYDEIICTTFAGSVFGLSTRPWSQPLHHGFSREGIVIIKKLRKEIESLQDQVSGERQKYQECMESDNAMSMLPQLDVQHRFDLCPDDGSYVLMLELACPIDNVMIQSDVPLDLVGSDNPAIVSFSSGQMEDGNSLLATYRCQANVSRLEMCVRTIEGHSGTLQVYVTPRVHPKMCRLLRFDIKPLSLHRRTHSVNEDRPLNVLKCTGQFGVRDFTSWLQRCLPEMSGKIDDVDISGGGSDGGGGGGGKQWEGRLMFESVVLGTQMDCLIKKGEMVLRSENISTIAILKEVISHEATKAKLKLDVNCEVNESSIPYILSLVHPKLESLLMLSKKVQVLIALKELEMSESDMSVLCEEYRDILAQGDQLEEQLKKQPCQLERLYGMITDLFIDKFKFKGQNVKSKVPALIKILENGDLDEIIKFFQAS